LHNHHVALLLFLLQDGFVKNVTDVVKIGDVVKVKVLSVDVAGKRLALSRKGLSPRPAAAAGAAAAADDVEDGECGATARAAPLGE
jgi:ribosomal protein S1